MNSRLFRKASLDRLASPDHLDQLIHISTSKSWAALLTLLMLAGMALIWACVGTMPTTVIGRGMIVMNNGLLDVDSRGSGLITNVNIEAGQHVKANQIVATIAQPHLEEKINQLKFAALDMKHNQTIGLLLKSKQSKLTVSAIQLQQANANSKLFELQQRAELAHQQISDTDQLYVDRLVTKHQIILAREALIDIQSQIQEQQSKIKLFDQEIDAARFDVRQAQLEMEQQRTTLERSISTSQEEFGRVKTVVSPYDGEVVEIKISLGERVEQGTPIVTIQPEHNTQLRAIVYIPSSRAEECKRGMIVQVLPSTIRREKYGFLKAHISFVGNHPTTVEAITRIFKNRNVVSALSNSDLFTELHIDFETDPSTASGFAWSSSHGPPLRLSNGTICDVQIITRRQKPIVLILPWLKGQIGAS